MEGPGLSLFLSEIHGGLTKVLKRRSGRCAYDEEVFAKKLAAGDLLVREENEPSSGEGLWEFWKIHQSFHICRVTTGILDAELFAFGNEMSIARVCACVCVFFLF